MKRPEATPAERQRALDLTDRATRSKQEREATHERPARVEGSYLEEVLGLYEDALAIDPGCALACFNAAVLFDEVGRADEAKRWYQRAIRRDPTLAGALVNLGVIAEREGDRALAAKHYERALAILPGDPLAAGNLAGALRAEAAEARAIGRPRDAIDLCWRAVELCADVAGAWFDLAMSHEAAGDIARASACYVAAIAIDPACAEAHNNLGVLAERRGDLEGALHRYARALEIQPRMANALNNVSVVESSMGKLVEAREALELALSIDPTHADAWNNLGVLARDEGDVEEAYRCYARALEHDPARRNAQHNLLMAEQYLPEIPREVVYRDHAAWGRAFQAASAPPSRPRRARAAGDRPIRVGYLSADFKIHSVSYFVDAILANHGPSCLAFCYSDVAWEDAKTIHLRGLAHAWRSVRGLDAREIAAMMRRDRIDVLVELGGHTSGNRLDVVALRPAPVAITYIGYPDTTGLPAVDYRIGDALTDPPGASQRITERLLRMPGCFLCYAPFGEIPEVGPPPSAARGHVTLACFNHLAKVNDGVLDVWARVLAALPGARILLKSKAFASPHVIARLAGRLADRGVAPDRVACAPLVADTRDHLALYGEADIALDTFPYAGTTTTCESLLMGVPVVTLSGRSHAQNVGRSLLHAAGFPELVAGTADAYVAIVCGLASDAPRLAELRRSLRGRLLASPLCDGATFTRKLEALYRRALRRARPRT